MSSNVMDSSSEAMNGRKCKKRKKNPYPIPAATGTNAIISASLPVLRRSRRLQAKRLNRIPQPKIPIVPIAEAYFKYMYNLEIASILDEKGNSEILYTAVRNLDQVALQLLKVYCDERCTKGVESVINRPSVRPLHLAVTLKETSKRFVEIVRILIDQFKAPINARDTKCRTALMLACEFQPCSLVEVLLQYYANVHLHDDKGGYALHYAARSGNTSTAEILLKHGACVNLRNFIGQTALHSTAMMADAQMARCLLNSNALVDFQDDDGNTPLHFSSFFGKDDVVLELLKHGAAYNLKQKDGATALHCAALSRRLDNDCVAKHLVEYGASLRATTPVGLTPLHCAGFELNVRVFQYLLKSGASVNVQDLLGRTPAHFLSQRLENTMEVEWIMAARIMDILEQHGADWQLLDNGGRPANYRATEISDEAAKWLEVNKEINRRLAHIDSGTL